MSKIVFILGAGASAHAQVPLTKNFFEQAINLIVEHKIDEEDREYFTMIRDVYQGEIRQISSNFTFDLKNIETIFSLIEMAFLTNKFLNFTSDKIKKLRRAINKFIVKTIEKTTYFNINKNNNIVSPQGYNMFYEHLLTEMKHNYHPIDFSIISFNYDLALDFVLEFYGGPQRVNYFLEESNPHNSIKLIKLHGSINWASCSKKNCKRIKAISIRDDIRLKGYPLRLLEASKVIKNLTCLCGNKFNDLPLIVPPTWNKTGNYNIENIWHQAVKEMSDATNFFIIGYSLPKTDLFFQYMIALGTLDIANLERFWVFDTDPTIEDKYDKLLGPDIKRKFKFEKMDFNNAILKIKKAIIPATKPKI